MSPCSLNLVGPSNLQTNGESHMLHRQTNQRQTHLSAQRSPCRSGKHGDDSFPDMASGDSRLEAIASRWFSKLDRPEQLAVRLAPPPRAVVCHDHVHGPRVKKTPSDLSCKRDKNQQMQKANHSTPTINNTYYKSLRYYLKVVRRGGHSQGLKCFAA